MTNLGATDANGVIVIEHLPAAVKIQSIVTMPSGFCVQATAFANSTRLACALNTLPHGQTWTIQLSVTTSDSGAKTAAIVKFSGIDPVQANNYALVTMTGYVAPVSGPAGGATPPPVPPNFILPPDKIVPICLLLP